MLRPGSQSAEHIPVVKYCSAEFSKAVVAASARQHGTHLMTAGVNRNTGQGQGTFTSLRLPVNLKRYSKGSSAASQSLCSSRYSVTKSGCQLETLWNEPCFPKPTIQQFLKGNSLLLLAAATSRQDMNLHFPPLYWLCSHLVFLIIGKQQEFMVLYLLRYDYSEK